MAIDRISAGNPLPPITQRLDVSMATPMTPGVVQPLVPVGPYMAPSPDAGSLPAQLQQGQDSLAALIKPNADGSGATARDSSAMQVNQLFFTRQLVWQAPDPAQLAASWRVMVKTYGEQYAAMQEQARGQHVPGNLFMAEQQPMLLREGPRPPLMLDSEAWRFAVYGWGGQRLMLRVLASDEDEEPAPPRRRAKVALRVELMIAGIGRVLIQMEAVGDGLLLELAAEEEAALRHVRLALPDIAQAVQRAGLRVVRCRLNRQLHAQRVHGNYPMQAAAASLSLPLFRAMAEVALMLTQPEAETEAQPEEAAPFQEPEPAIIMSKEVAAPLGYEDGDGKDSLAPDGQLLLLAEAEVEDLLPPIDEQD